MDSNSFCPPKIMRLHTKVREMFRQITRKLWAKKDLRFGQIVYILLFHNISFSWLLPQDGFQFTFFVPCLLRDRENEELFYLGFTLI